MKVFLQDHFLSYDHRTVLTLGLGAWLFDPRYYGVSARAKSKILDGKAQVLGIVLGSV